MKGKHQFYQTNHSALQRDKTIRPQEIIVVRECRNNFAHGPMKLQTKNVVVEYRGKQITCEKMVYGCQFCDYELHEKWMEEKLNEELARIYKKKFNA